MTQPLRFDEYSDEDAGIHAILDDIVQLVEAARTMPFSEQAVINRTHLLGLLDELRDALPKQLAQADEMLAEADQVLELARQRAEETLAQARAHAMQMVDRERVVREAQLRAEEIAREADESAARLRADADDYCDRRLAAFEVDLDHLLAQVQAGRAVLAERLAGTYLTQ